MTGDEMHAAVVAAFDRHGNIAADATPLPWRVTTLEAGAGRGDILNDAGQIVARDMLRPDAVLAVTLRNAASVAYRGARRIIERHAPWRHDTSHPLICTWCAGAWPCVDYLDAAKAVPNLPEGVTCALRR